MRGMRRIAFLVVCCTWLCVCATTHARPTHEQQQQETKSLLGDVVNAVGEVFGFSHPRPPPESTTTAAATTATAVATAIASDGGTATATAVASIPGGTSSSAQASVKFKCLDVIRGHLDRFHHPHTCLYGLNCGHGCAFRPGHYLDDDDLDTACYHHALCVDEAGEDSRGRCECHASLHAAAVGVVELEVSVASATDAHADGCPWCEFWCDRATEPSAKHLAAVSITASMSIQLSFEQCEHM